VFRTSAATLVVGDGPPDAFRPEEMPGVAVVAAPSVGCKCARCWRVLEEVKPPTMLCLRCTDAVADWDARAA
jgi:isoleucyl-tRNA synthetase